MVKKTPQLIEQAVETTVQSAVRSNQTQGLSSILIGFGYSNNIVPKWWSRSRDKYLDNFWRESDNLSGALYILNAKMTTIPFRVFPKDKSIKIHQQIADDYTRILVESSQFGAGWVEFFGKFIEAYCSQDNGAFAEIIGDGSKDGPIEGQPLTIATLDSSRCTRSSNPIYPVVYTDTDGKMYKLHYTRVLFKSSMPSSRADMNGIGFSAVSRCIQSTQNLIDMSVYKQEKLGSRPPRQIVITKGGLDPDDLAEAIAKANASMNNQGLSRFAKTVAVGSANLPNAELQVLDLISAPDGFDEQKSTIIGMVIIANALGMDAKEIFPMSGEGGTKADAIIQHLKQRGKGPGQILQMIENELDQKFLPPFLYISFDYQDEAQDRQAAEIESIRAQARQRDIADATIDDRVAREQMLEHEEISQAQFEQLELNNGRLVDGVSVETLFYSPDKDFVMLLEGYKQPPKPKVDMTNPSIMIEEDETNEPVKIKIMQIITSSKDVSMIKKARQALAAIEFRENKYKEIAEKQNAVAERQQQNAPDAGQGNQIGQGRPKKVAQADSSYNGEKLGGNKQPTAPAKPQDEENAYAKEIQYIIPNENHISQLLNDMVSQRLSEQDKVISNYMKELEDMQITVVIPPNAIKLEVTMPEQKASPIIVNVPEQKAAVINVTVPEQKTPVINVHVPKQEQTPVKEKKLKVLYKDGKLDEVIVKQ